MQQEIKSTPRDRRRLKYGTVAVVFTVIFAAFVILLNAVLSFVSDRFGGFYLDLTSETIYELSDASLEVLGSLDDYETPRTVEILFCTTEDKIADNDYLSYVNRLAEKYRAASRHITLSYKDVVKEPAYFAEYKKTGTVSSTSVIISCAETKKHIVYPLTKFFKLSSETGRLFAYDGENKLTAAIMQTAATEVFKAGLVTGHGEDKRESLAELLREQGYEVSDVKLDAVTKEELAAYDLLVICNPKYDLTGVSESLEGRADEITQLNRYLTESFGSLLVFIDPNTPNLPEFSGFLEDDWNVKYVPGSVVVEGAGMSIDRDGLYFIGTPYTDDPSSVGYALHKAVTSTGAMKTVFGAATPLLPTRAENGYKTTSPVYATTKDAVCMLNGETATGAALPVMTVTNYAKTTDNVENNAYVLVCGSTEFLNFLDSDAYANGDVLRQTFHVMGNTTAVTGIKYKVVEDTAITVTMDDFKKYILLLAVCVPLLIAAVGTIVYLRRKKA